MKRKKTSAKQSGANEKQRIRQVLYEWRDATRAGRKDDVLANHARDVLIYDPLPPFRYKGAAAYRKSFDEWWPETEGESKFDFEDLKITAGEDVAYAHGSICCGGTKPNGETFEDRVRLTVCLRKVKGKWVITHSHSSMPLDVSGSG
jgi:ketosteroid isomerase-like protein